MIRSVRGTAVLLCLLGAGLTGWAFHRVPEVFPGATVLAAVLQLPLLFLGWWLLRLARPLSAPARTWSAAAVIWGATAATGSALSANQGLTGLWAKGAGVEFASNWSAALTAPVNEELLKVSGVVLIVLAAPRVIRGPVDGMIFGALTGLGFQVVENFTYALNMIPLTGATDPAQAVVISAFARVGLTSLGSHWAMTAVAGAGVGYLAARELRRGALPAAACLAVAMAMHLLFDAPGPGAIDPTESPAQLRCRAGLLSDAAARLPRPGSGRAGPARCRGRGPCCRSAHPAHPAQSAAATAPGSGRARPR